MAKTEHTIAGTITDASNAPLPGLLVRAYDADVLTDDDFLGEGRTNAAGVFVIKYRKTRFVKNILEAFFEGGPDLVLKVYDASMTLHHTTPRRRGASRFETYAIRLSGKGAAPSQPAGRAVPVRRQAFARIVDETSGTPVARAILQARQLTVEGAPRDLGRLTANEKGTFTLPYFALPDGSSVVVELSLIGPDDAEIARTEVTVPPDVSATLTARVSLPALSKPSDARVDEVAAMGDVPIPDALREFLEALGIRSLADIRKAGGLANVKGLPVDRDSAAVRTLDAHAHLTRLPIDVATAGRLFAAGYTAPSDIALTSRSKFLALTSRRLDHDTAVRIHTTALNQTALLNNLVIGSGALGAGGRGGATLEGGLQFGPSCECSGCNSATSPLAYLTDLLAYTLRTLRNADASDRDVTMTFLQDTFHQAFGYMTAGCEILERTERQNRLCIEVLRRHIESTVPRVLNPPDLMRAEAAYRSAAYFTLLSRLGSSYDQLRAVRGSDAGTRRLHAARLGVPDDKLGAILLDPDARVDVPSPLTAAPPVTEHRLERLFGLQDTTHDPLSRGAKSNDTSNQLTRWSLRGVSWNRNTDAEGVIAATLSRPSPTQTRIELFRDAARTELVASGQSSTAMLTIDLVEENGSGLSGTAEVAYTAGAHGITIQAIPQLLAWRLQQLRRDWAAGDHPEDSYTGASLPQIDPDLIGPEDFRVPVAKTAAGDPDRPFDVWLRRRAWIDGERTRLSTLRRNQGIAHALGQAQPSPVPDLAALRTQLDTDAVAASSRIEALNVSVEAFRRLMEIQSAPPATVTGDEWSEADAILTQASKRAQYAVWRAEETIALGPADFWISLREPEPGAWPPHRGTGTPWLDPDVVTDAGTPQGTAGQRARTLLAARRAQLTAAYGQISGARESNGFEAMLVRALGTPSAAAASWTAHLDQIALDLQSSTASVAAAARTAIGGLRLSEDEFAFLMSVRRRQQSPGTQVPAEEWKKLYSLLTRIDKERRFFTTWVSEEDVQTGGASFINYWSARRMALPLWLASAEARQQWQQALRDRSLPPLIDPDLLGPSDFARPSTTSSGDGPFDLLQRRRDWKQTFVGTLEATAGTPAAKIDTLFTRVTGLPLADLQAAIAAEPDTTEARLRQLGLSPADHTFVTHLRSIASQPSPAILQAEWQQLYATLAEVEQRRVMWPAWREEERAAGIVLGPDDFVPSGQPPAADAAGAAYQPFTSQWRAMLHERRDWIERLRARIAQQELARTSLEAAVTATEADVLPSLRDALIAASNMPGNDLAAKGEAVTTRLLIDGRLGGMHDTTRVVQAIQTLQGLLWAVRTGQLQDVYPSLSIDTPGSFDNEWATIGSFGAWRAAMFTAMYPENILLPNLRSRQSPAFMELSAALRGNRRLTAEDACAAARRYSEYFDDVCSIKPDACAEAVTRTAQGAGCARTVSEEARRLLYLFGRGGTSNRAYWCTWDNSPEAAYPQSFWTPIRGFDDIEVVQLIGASVFNPASQNRGLYLFAIVVKDSKQGLAFTRYDLDTAQWDGTVTPLDLDDDMRPDEVLFKLKVTQESEPPEVGVFLPGGVVRSRRLGRDGKRWETTGFVPVVAGGAWHHLSPRGDGDPPDADLDCSEEGVEAAFAVVGDFNGDGIDEIAVARSDSGNFWIRRFDFETRRWESLADARTGGPAPRADLTVVGDFDGDGRAEIAVCQQGPMGPTRRNFWVLKYNLASEDWERSEFSSSPTGHEASYAVAGDFDGDGRDEIAVAIHYEGTQNINNDFWVVDYVPDQGWRRLSAAGTDPLAEDFSCSTARSVRTRFAVAGDFNGDGRDELAVALDYEGNADAERENRDARDQEIARAHAQYEQDIKTDREIYESVEKKAREKRDDAIWLANNTVQTRESRKAAIDLAQATYDAAIAVSKAAYEVTAAAAALVRDARIGAAWTIWTEQEGPAATHGNDFWVMRWDDTTWTHLSPIAGSPFELDLSCDDGDVQSKFGLAGRFTSGKEDRRYELAVAKATHDGNDFWVKRYDPVRKVWDDAGSIDCTSKRDYLTKASTAVTGDFDGDGRDEIAVAPEKSGTDGNDFWVMDYAPDTRAWRHLTPGGHPFDADMDCSIANVGARFAVSGRFENRAAESHGIAAAIDAPGNNDFWVMYYGVPSWHECSHPELTLAPAYSHSTAITTRLTAHHITLRRKALERNQTNPNLVYLEEAWYFVPIQIALQLQLSGEYDAALDWLRTVYDYSKPEEERKVYHGLKLEEDLPAGFRRPQRWLQHQSNPHEIAAMRRETYTRFTILALVRCFLEYADVEFARYTAESLPRATTLYLTALELLGTEAIRQEEPECVTWISTLERDVAAALMPPDWTPVWHRFKQDLGGLPAATFAEIRGGLTTALTARGAWDQRFARAASIVSGARAGTPARPTFAAILDAKPASTATLHALMMESPEVANAVLTVGATARAPMPLSGLLPHFCVEPNPVLAMLRLWADVNLFKLRQGRNIAGETAPPPLFANAPGLLGAGPGAPAQQVPLTFTLPPRYRYSYLVEKARQHCTLAQQLGAALLATIEKKNQLDYNLLMSRNALEIAGATIELKSLMVQEANDGRDVATRQLTKASVQRAFWDERIDRGPMALSIAEMGGMGLMAASGALQGLSATLYFLLSGPAAFASIAGGVSSTVGLAMQPVPTGYGNLAGLGLMAAGGAAVAGGLVSGGSMIAQGLSGLAGAVGTFGSLSLTFANFERRFEDWRLNQTLSGLDESIAHTQIRLADDRIAITEKDRDIGIMQHAHDRAVVELLTNQFANAELYEWMIGVLTAQYRTVVHVAVATAKLAQSSLEFERQEPIRVIQGDYWAIDDTSLTATQRASGLLGAERLASDLAQLDHFKINTDKRHLQIAKTISLSQAAPQDFYHFRQTGRIELDTLMHWFDRDFPGQYLRLIKSVKVSVIALVPPVEGMHAVLSNAGASSVVVRENGHFVKKRSMRTFGEQIALDSPYNETGLFSFNYDDPMFLPFEGLGVESRWTLELPRAANRFDFGTIADVLVTLEYTALQDEGYRQQVIEDLGTTLATDAVIDVRVYFPDHWYHLKNPRSPSDNPALTLTLPERMFAPGLEGPITVKHVTGILLHAGGTPTATELTIRKLRPAAASGAPRVTERQLSGLVSERGVLSTRDLTANPFLNAPSVEAVGDWELAFPASVYEPGPGGRRPIDDLDDVVVVLTVEGEVRW